MTRSTLRPELFKRPDAHIQTLLTQPEDDIRAVRIALAGEGNIEFQGYIGWLVDAGVRRLLAVDRMRAECTVILEAEPLGNKTPIVMRRDSADEVKLIACVAEPIHRHDPERANRIDHRRLDASIVKIAEEELHGVFRVSGADLGQQRFTEPWTIFRDERSSFRTGRIEVPKSGRKIVPKLDDFMPERDQGIVQIRPPKLRRKIRIGRGIRSVENAHRWNRWGGMGSGARARSVSKGEQASQPAKRLGH